MRRRAVWVAAGLVAISAAGCRGCGSSEGGSPAGAPAAQISTYRAPSGEFSIGLPGVPETRKEPDGRTVYQLRSAGQAYTVSKLACPAEFAAAADPRALYDTLRDRTVTAAGGELKFERDLNSAGRAVPGREVVVEAKTPGTGEPNEMLVRLFRDGDSVWLLEASGPREEASRLHRLGVLDSFTLLP
jgi:hypothetical protein